MDRSGHNLTRPVTVPSASNGTYLKSGVVNGSARPFTVDEALPYSPLSSVVPFNTDVIPLPTIGLRASASLFATAQEELVSRKDLELLNHDASGPTRTSERLENTLRELQQLLQSGSLTEFKFNTGPTVMTSNQAPDHVPPKLRLSSFAKMIYENTEVSFRPLTPKSLGSGSTVGKVRNGNTKQKSPVLSKHSAIPKPTSTTTLKNSHVVNNHEAHVRNSSIQVVIPTPRSSKPLTRLLESPRASPERSANDTGFTIVVSQASNIIKTEDYELLPDSPSIQVNLSSKKRKRLEVEDEDFLDHGPDHREKADAAFRSFQEFLQDIFEAEDQINSNSAGDFFVFTGDDIPSLTSVVQAKVESMIKKIVSLGIASQVPVDDLIRLQKLCEGSLKAAGSVDIKIEETWDESDVASWLERLSNAEIGLKSARTALRLMSAGREEKQLYSEEIIMGALTALNNVVDSCVIPIVELRASGSSSGLFKLLSAEKKAIGSAMNQCRFLLTRLTDLVDRIELSDTVINTLEFAVSRLIFVENAHTEKDSVLGVKSFDSLRVAAMDALAQIFSCHPVQRTGIVDEILTSLEKLPVSKQSARQFKLAEGGSIQLVSALIMRLIQTCANKSDETKGRRTARALEALDESADDEPGEIAAAGSKFNSSRSAIDDAHDNERRAVQQSVTSIQELHTVVAPLLESANKSAYYVVNFITMRAMRSTKTGDDPYRVLLDHFVQDFITCLGSTDWPGAEILLRTFLIMMVKLADSEKTPAPAKNMALEVLGEMGAAISQLNSQVRKLASSFDNADTEEELGCHLARLADSFFEGKLRSDDLVAWTGPYRASLEFLDERSSAETFLQSAVGYHLADWAAQVCSSYDLIADEDPDRVRIEEDYGRLAFRLRKMINDRKWLSTEYSFKSVSTAQARLAYTVTLLNSLFCKSFDRVLMILLGSMSSDQATVRSKSLKSVNQVLETDPTILDRSKHVLRLIVRCSNDSSVQVRDSALGLLGKCIDLRPGLEGELTPEILQRVTDSGVGVRKRAMKLLKDIYLRNKNKQVRSLIADALLHRVADLDEGVQELARQTIEEVWMSPFYQLESADNIAVQDRLAVVDQVVLMVKTVQRSPGVAAVLDKILQGVLSNNSKFTAQNFRVCKTLVATMFETIISNSGSETAESVETRDALQLLMTFAKANAKLFTTDQIQLLQPYITDLKTENDLAMFRCVVVIFRHVFPQLSTLHSVFLSSVRATLMPSVSRVNRALLDDVFACLWIISGVLESTEHLARLLSSTLDNIRKTGRVNLSDPSQAAHLRRLTKCLTIAGMCGKHCDLDSQGAVFKKSLPTWTGNSVSKLMVDIFAPFASPSQPLEVRKAALDAIGLVCQSWPKNFSSANIYTSFMQAFQEQSQELESVILRSLNDFFKSEEQRSDPDAEAIVGSTMNAPATLGVMGGSQHDGVAIDMYQRFMKDITRIALSTQDEHAVVATEILVSINRQGLNHPKECGPTFVALETSQNHRISELAFQQHRALHQKHETILEKESMRSVQAAFSYQRDIVKNTRGATTEPYASKLCLLMEVLKISKVKSRKRFYDSLCSRIDFDPAKLNVSEESPSHLQYSRFIIENMAFFEYPTMEELLAAIGAMEKVVTGTGTGVAHAIETEVFSLRMDPAAQQDHENYIDIQDVSYHAQPMPFQSMNPQQASLPYTRFQQAEDTITPFRLRQLTASSMILSSLWEARTHLRRTYGLMNNRRETKGKPAVKDLNRAPVKSPGITGDKFWEEITKTMSSLSSPESMMEQCKAFVELLTVDKDFKLAAEGDDDVTARARITTPSEDEADGTPAPPNGSGRGRKRKGSNTPGGRKKRARSSSKNRSRKGRRSSTDDEDEDGNWD